jgi:transcriptional regulator with XRE-family HTH domain
MRPLREIRRSQFMTIEELAEKAGVSTKTIVEAEMGRTRPKFRTIRRISEALGVEPGDVAEFAATVAPGEEAEAKKLAA